MTNEFLIEGAVFRISNSSKTKSKSSEDPSKPESKPLKTSFKANPKTNFKNNFNPTLNNLKSLQYKKHYKQTPHPFRCF